MYVYDSVISLQPHRNTRSSDVTLARPPLYSSLKVNNPTFRHTPYCLWNERFQELRQPVDE